MKKGGYQQASRGFTIVETMIVLAVTSALFISVAVVIGGRQSKTQFTTAINSLQQQVQQIINEASNGYFPNSGGFSCVSAGTKLSFTTVVPTSQGTNSGCIFVGKAIQFGLGGGASAYQYGVLPLAGYQYIAGSTDPVTTVAQARVRAVYPVNGEAGPTNIATVQPLQNGLQIASSSNDCNMTGPICYKVAGVAYASGAMAFVAGDATGNITPLDSNGNVSSGSQQLSLYGVKTSIPNESLAEATKFIGNNPTQMATGLIPATNYSVCIASGSTNQSGLITIDSSLHVNLQIMDGTQC
jgi:type II secretory pathway pseudopilin PulG